MNGHTEPSRRASPKIDVEDPPVGLLLNNKGTGNLLPLFNPKDGSKIPVEVHAASIEDVEKAVTNARAAFESGPWSTWSGEQRAKVINRLADLIDENGDAIALLESICSGRLKLMLVDEIPRMTNSLRYFAGWADKIKGDSYPPDDGFYKIVRKEPLGVCCGITAWNASLLFLAWKAGPALAAGNTFILKPSEKSFLGSLAVASLIEAAGFPPGVFQIIVGAGEVGAHLSSHMDVNKISFTGSSAVGRRIQVAAAQSNLKRVTLELGGKSPAIVFDDADIEKALFWVTLGITVNTGQVCSASSRLFVQNSIADSFIIALKERMSGMGQMLGLDPQDMSSQYGPVVDEAQYRKIMQYIDTGKESNEMIVGGTKYDKKGYYIAPTIFLDPGDDAAVWKEEIFGPVLCIRTFETEAEVIKEANNTRYGLSGRRTSAQLSPILTVVTRSNFHREPNSCSTRQ
ncbi:hypothetical protein LTR10_020884 [Elasticomyces elasticus]|uniref:aldehyde dehydrogenase (NAD(+)) n=1 Tax=Exophiala sideris TaxID=1016849 RepID=A0ABR0IZZ3_9EURO|nr:hypothetical protein LTR10_020884 [Elasticomyces elasticus]KAK5028221.1 hypothetical protein LTR13_009209 [Exophiala sideris]KAK5052879.1 hypothetical protein LTR69_009705 [Exophiala sideris]KAK5178490.1 hypothetical protein LTR44_009115 [Eurotiomycetes sp. CCFEE 6388]